MTFKILSGRSISLGMAMLLGFIILGSIAMQPVAAQDKNVTCIGADLGSYAELGFCLAPQVVVEPESVDEANYTAGREVRASMLLNGSRASIHLLYPCQPPQTMLEPAALKTLIEAYEPALAQANYSDSMLSISGFPAIWGQVSNLIFAAYQPTNQTPALVVMDSSMNEDIMADFLPNLRITVKEGNTPIGPGYCPDTTTVAAEAEPVEAQSPEVQPAQANAENNAAASSQVTGQTTPAETRQSAFESAKDKMAADREAAKKKLEEAKERMKNF
jgi:hypothetical protein